MKITLQAGEDSTLSLEGFGFYVVAADGPIIAELREIDGRVDQSGLLLPGQGLQGANRYEAVRVINMHTAAQTIQIYSGARSFVDNRNVGIVEVSGVVSVDPVPNSVYPAFEKFVGGSPGAGNYAHGQLYNPVGSGVDLYVQEVTYSSNADAIVYMQRYDTQLSSDLGSGVAVRDSADISKGNIRREYPASLLGGTAWMRVTRGLANTSKELGLVQPMKLKEGEGLILKNNSVGSSCYFSFKWEERPNV